MRYPNLRYGNPAEFAYQCQGIPIEEIAKRLKRSERSISNWLSGAEKMPWWVPEILRLQRMEHTQMLYQMNMKPMRTRLGLVTATATIVEFPALKPYQRPAEPGEEMRFRCEVG